jgi:3-oxoadipate enol-lactonase
MTDEYISNRTRLGFQTRSAGLPVVFLHPTPLDHSYWHPLVDRLPGIYTIAPDLRGHGDSALSPGPGPHLPAGGFALVPDAPVLSMEQYALDIIALLHHLELERAVFAGCSVGGYILLELWRRIPQRMQALAFVCSKPQPDTPQTQAKRAENIARARAEGTSGIFDGMAQSLLGATARSKHPEMVVDARAHMTLTTEAFIAVQAGLATRPDSLATVATITAPMLAIAGGQDAAVTRAEMEAFHGAPGGCDFHLLENAGHFAALEEPDRVAGIFSSWLRAGNFM